MPMYEVNIEETRVTSIYVEADSEREAEDDAIELAAGFDDSEWGWRDADYHTYEGYAPVGRYWTGGDNGHWVEVDD